MARPKRPQAAEGFWDRPALMDLLADVLFVLAIAGLGWALTTVLQRLPFFPLREVVVTTPLSQVSPPQIEHAARVALSGNFFTIDLDNARASFEKLPWVRRAEVRRRWPDILELAVEEHVAVARWKQADAADSQDSRLVNSHGEVFAAAAPDHLPLFAGPEGSAAQLLASYQQFGLTLAAIGRRPQTLVLSAREAWQIKLDNGLVLELGRDESKHPLAERIARFTRHYPAAAARLRVAGGVADMRYPNGFTLRMGKQG